MMPHLHFKYQSTDTQLIHKLNLPQKKALRYYFPMILALHLIWYSGGYYKPHFVTDYLTCATCCIFFYTVPYI